jgi:ATP-dependent Clp protease ATP-binding subunit ClpA
MMNFEKYTNSSKKIINAAQNLALGKKHQKITPMHIFSELLNSNHDLIVKALEGSDVNQIKISSSKSIYQKNPLTWRQWSNFCRP